MALTFMSEEWARAVCDAMNESSAYRKAARSWKHGPVVLEVRMPDGCSRYLHANVDRGHCESIEVGEDGNPKAAMIISGPADVWKTVLYGNGNPAAEIARGRLKFKGNWLYLMRYQKAAMALVDAVSAIDTEFPGE